MNSFGLWTGIHIRMDEFNGEAGRPAKGIKKNFEELGI